MRGVYSSVVQKISRKSTEAGNRDLGDAARDARNWPEAISHYQAYLKSHPDSFAIWVQLGHAFKETQNKADALRCYLEALHLNERDADLLFHIGYIYKTINQDHIALEYFKKSYEIDNNENARAEIDAFSEGVGPEGVGGHLDRAHSDPGQAASRLRIRRDIVATETGYKVFGPKPTLTFVAGQDARPSGVWRLTFRGRSPSGALKTELVVYATGGAVRARCDLPDMLDDQSCSFVLTQPEAVEKIELLPRLSVGADFELTVTHSDGENSFYERVFESVGPTDALDDGYPLDLIPANHLESSAPGAFTSTDIDPQFLIAGLAEAPVRGWTVMRLAMTTDEPVRPTLYVWSAGDIIEIPLPILNGAAAKLFLLRLPDQVDSMRFDPTDRVDVEISGVGISAHALAQVPPAVFMPVEADVGGPHDPDQDLDPARDDSGHGSSRLRIRRDIVATGSGYRVCGPKPAFTLAAGEEAQPSGVWALTFRGRSPSGPLKIELRIHATVGAGRARYELPEILGDQTHSVVLNLPESVARIDLLPRLSVGAEFDLTVTHSDAGDVMSGRLFEPAGPTDALDDGHRLDLIPANHLESSAPGEFTSTDIDPQFLIEGLAEAPVQGWTVMRITMTTDEPVVPTFYIWSGSDITEIRLPIFKGSADRLLLVRLPDQVDRMRFDPTDRADVVISNVGLSVQSFAHAPPVAFMPLQTNPRGRQNPNQALGRPGHESSMLRIRRDIVATESGYRVSGPQPTLMFVAGEGAAPSGIWRLTLRGRSASGPLTTELVVQATDGAVRSHYDLPELVGDQARRLVLNLPDSIEDIELCPRLSVGDEFDLTVTQSDDAESLSERLFEPAGPTDRLRDGYRLDLIPANHLEGSAPGVFTSTDIDPQFLIAGLAEAPVRGWTVLRLTMATDEPVRPTLYVWSEGEITEIPLPIVNGKADKLFLLRLPAQVDILRFDPTDRADVVMSGVGLTVQSFAHAPPAAFMPVENDLRRIQYDSWVSLYDQISAEDEVIIRHRISVIPDKPLISVLMPVYNPEPRFLVKAIESVRSQIYENWELCIADDASTNPEINSILGDYRSRDPRIKVIFRSENGHISASSNSALEMVSGEFVGLMDHDDELPRHALYMVAVELTSSPDIDIIYTDEDKVDSQGRRHDPYFKSSWSLDLFYSQNFVAHFGVYRTSLIRMIGGFRVGFEGSQDYDLVLRLLPLTRPERIRHIPHVLYHWRIYEGVSTFSTDNPGRSLDSARRALVEHFELAGESVEVVELPNFPSWWRIVRPAPSPEPLVTIIIPTRDRVELVKNCIESIKRHTKYSNYEIIVVDNASVEDSTLGYFFSLKYRRIAKIIRVDEPFNYSRLNNLAAAEANGDLLLLLNNDVVVINPDWLTELVTQVLRKGVGAVGAKLRYQNDTLQHAGVTLGLNGAAGHGHRHFPHDSIGYFGWPQLQRDVSAVTAAALIVRKDVFYEVGGLDELNLIVSYNDVDLCLKIGEHGYRIIYDPFVDLYHLESVSRGADITRAQKDLQRREREFLVGRWGDSLARDPFYSPNLSLDSEDFQIAFPPRAEKPWRRSPASMDVIAAEQQRRFNLTAQVSPYALQTVALQTVVVIANEAPYSTLSAFAAHLKGEKLLPARVVIVDSDVARESHTGRAVIEAWRSAFPTAPVDVVAQGGANLDIGEQVRSGLASVVAAAHVVVIAEECSSFAPHSFEFLLRSYVHLGCETAICGIAIDPDSRVELVADAAGLRLRSDEPVDLFGVYESLPAPTYVTINELLEWDPVAPTHVVNSGLFMGRSEWFLADDDTSGISYKTIQGVLADISRGLEGGGHRMATTSTCLVSLRRARSRDLPVAWKHFYDFVWLNRSASGVAPPDMIEFVCPFHRGDVIIGLQVANALVQTGNALRFHVAAGLLSWAGDFEPEFELVGLDLEVPSAERTSLEFWRGLIQVIARSDSSPSIVLSHPERSLDELRKNLVGSMMEAAGLQPFDMLEPMAPKPSLQQVTAGQEALEAFAGPLVLLHASGGWELKTIPDDLVSRLVALAHEEGFKVVQIGGPTDPPIEACDGHILAALNPGEWSVVFRGAKALMGVDSWSAHLAEILDLPQLTLYGSTQPEHVSSHGYFPSSSAKLVFPPQVDCSPCNSTVCLINGTQRCDGYWIDVSRARLFLRSLADDGIHPVVWNFACTPTALASGGWHV